MITPDHIKGYLKAKGATINKLSKAFKVSPGHIKRIIEDPENGLKLMPRGWIKTR